MIMNAKEVAPFIFNILVEVIDEEYKDEPEAVKQEAIARILSSMSVSS